VIATGGLEAIACPLHGCRIAGGTSRPMPCPSCLATHRPRTVGNFWRGGREGPRALRPHELRAGSGRRPLRPSGHSAERYRSRPSARVGGSRSRAGHQQSGVGMRRCPVGPSVRSCGWTRRTSQPTRCPPPGRSSGSADFGSSRGPTERPALPSVFPARAGRRAARFEAAAIWQPSAPGQPSFCPGGSFSSGSPVLASSA